MSITLNQSQGDNTVSIFVQLPSGGSSTVLLDFESDYDKQEIFRNLDVTQRGEWIVGTISSDRIPDTGNYTVKIHDSVSDSLAINDIHIALNEITQSIDNITGPSRDELIKIIKAVVYGADFPSPNQPTVISRTISQPPAKSTAVSSVAARDTKLNTYRS